MTEGVPVGAWRERLGQNGACQICAQQDRETLPHAFADCEEVQRAWTLFRRLRSTSGQPQAYTTWKEISRGLLTEPSGPSVEADLQWDTAAAFTINAETPWDVLRAQLLWAIWCQRVAHAFSDERFHLGLVLWHAWKNTIYCAMEAYKELHRHKRNEEKRQEQISCFQKVWTTADIFGRLSNTDIKWHLTPPAEFLPQELGAWMASPIRIIRRSPSPDSEAEFVAQQDFPMRVQEFLDEIGNNFPLPNDTQIQADIGEQPDSPIPQVPETQCDRNHHNETVREDSNSERRPFTNLNQNDPSTPTTNHHLRQNPHPGEENQRPHTGPPPRSRQKIRCTFGPSARRQASVAAFTAREQDETEREESNELDALLQEIEHTRQQDWPTSGPSSPTNEHPTTDPRHTPLQSPSRAEETYPEPKGRPTSRIKTRCRFGPYKRHRAAPPRQAHATTSDSTPRQSDTLLPPPVLSVPVTPTVEDEELTPLLPYRVTLQPPMVRGGTPFSRYYATAAEPPRSNPIRPPHERLGLSEAEFDARVAQEVDEELRMMRLERQLNRITANSSPEAPRVLTREDCMIIFRATGAPTHNSLYGVWLWAADLGRTRFNFEWDNEDYSVFDAYD